jgi:predicted CoA-substrate-specific enzyme activase
MEIYLGIDVGSASTKIVAIDKNFNIISSVYLMNNGKPIFAVKEGLILTQKRLLPHTTTISGCGVTGSGRRLIGHLVGADVIKNEILSHAIGTIHFYKDVSTIIEIGGQDSKLIIIRDGIITDFSMNTVCAAGCGSFLEYQAKKLGLTLDEFSKLPLKSTTPAKISGRCTVFAETDIVYKIQQGIPIEDIICGLCESMAANYLNNLGKGKDIIPPIVFQGGVAANEGVKRALEKILGYEIIVPKYYATMGAIGCAILAKEEMEKNKERTKFLGFDLKNFDFQISNFECHDCANQCEIVEVYRDKKLVDRTGSICGKWDYN